MAKIAEDKTSRGIYVPPSMKAGAIGTKPPGDRKEDFTVRVTNLPEDTTEEDLKEIFNMNKDRQRSSIHRTFLARDKINNRCKGFAFVTFNNREDAERAILTVSGHRYDHLILKVEWSKHTNFLMQDRFSVVTERPNP